VPCLERAAYVLLSKESFRDTWPSLLRELRLLGAVAYSNPKYELIRVSAGAAGAAMQRMTTRRPPRAP
jgi:hypothetical protein